MKRIERFKTILIQSQIRNEDVFKLEIQNYIVLNGRCEICLTDTEIVRHHITYFPEKTIPVCKNCHLKIHKANRKYGLSHLKPPNGHAWCFYHGYIPRPIETKEDKKIKRKKEFEKTEKNDRLWNEYIKGQKFSEPIDVILLNTFKKMNKGINLHFH